MSKPRLLIFFLSLTLATLASAAPRPLQVDDYFRLARVGDPQISPDGTRVAYTVSTSDLEKDESETALWMTPVGGEDERYLAWYGRHVKGQVPRVEAGADTPATDAEG